MLVQKSLVRLSAFLFFLSLFFVSVTTAQAATITVTNTNDSGTGSLRQAFIDASNGDTIDFDNSLSWPLVLSTEIVTDKVLTVQGLGKDVTVISGNSATRLFVVDPDGDITFKNLTLSDANGNEESGGIIVGRTDTNITFEDSELSDSTADNGAGIFSDGDVTIRRSSFTNLSVNDVGGGAIFHRFGALIIEDSTFLATHADIFGDPEFGRGGAIYSWTDATISNTKFAYNSANEGGAIYSFGELVSEHNFFESNVAEVFGGAIRNYNGGSITAHNNLFYNNRVKSSGAGIYSVGSGVELTATNTIFNGNIARLDNTPTGEGKGGGVYTDVGTANFTNVTFSGNEAYEGANLFNGSTGTATVVNTLLDSNNGTNCDGTIINGGYNLQYPRLECGSTIPEGNPMLNYVSPAPDTFFPFTLEPLLHSDIMDAGNQTVCAASPINNLDINGSPRPNDGDFDGTATCEIGAVEAQIVDTPTIDDFVVLGYRSVFLRQGTTVNTGDVGSLYNVDPSERLDSNVSTSIGGSVQITNSHSQVYGDTIKLKAGSQIYDAVTNALSGPGTVLATTSSYTEGFDYMPSVTGGYWGTTNISVPAATTQHLTPGSYGNLTVYTGATVTLEQGIYYFNNIDMRTNSKMLFDTDDGQFDVTIIQVQDKLKTTSGVEIGPAPGSGDTADDARLVVQGYNGTGTTGLITETPKAAEFGSNNIIKMNVYTPAGTLWIKQDSTGVGSFFGNWVEIGNNVNLTLDSYYWEHVGQY